MKTNTIGVGDSGMKTRHDEGNGVQGSSGVVCSFRENQFYDDPASGVCLKVGHGHVSQGILMTRYGTAQKRRSFESTKLHASRALYRYPSIRSPTHPYYAVPNQNRLAKGRQPLLSCLPIDCTLTLPMPSSWNSTQLNFKPD